MITFVATTLKHLLVSPPLFLLRAIIIHPAAYTIHFVTLPPRYVLFYTYAFLQVLCDLLRSFETIYIFVGSAIFIGALAGLGLYLTSYTLITVLRIAPAHDTRLVAAAERTAATRRRQRLQMKRMSVGELGPTGLDLPSGRQMKLVPGNSQTALAAQTILEEDEESDAL